MAADFPVFLLCYFCVYHVTRDKKRRQENDTLVLFTIFYGLNNQRLKLKSVMTDLSKIWILRDIIVVSEHGHRLQVLCNVS